MRIRAIGGILCLVLAAMCAPAGDIPKTQAVPGTVDRGSRRPEWRLGSSHQYPRWLEWNAPCQGGAQAEQSGSVRRSITRWWSATISNSQTSRRKRRTRPWPGQSALGSFPSRRTNSVTVQCLRDFQVQQKEFLLDLLDYRPSDKKAAKQLADLQPTTRDTAAVWIAGTTWTLEVAPVLLEFLPKQALSGPNIDWEGRITWKKAKSK